MVRERMRDVMRREDERVLENIVRNDERTCLVNVGSSDTDESATAHIHTRDRVITKNVFVISTTTKRKAWILLSSSMLQSVRSLPHKMEKG